MDLSAHPHLLAALNTTAQPDQARNRVARSELTATPTTSEDEPERESA
jgi:hypothetical protein